MLPLIVLLSTISQTPAAQDQTQAPKDNSVLQVKPGGEVIKQKDLWIDTGYSHPFLRMPKYFVQAQKAIWTSPFHTAKSDIKYRVTFGAAVAE